MRTKLNEKEKKLLNNLRQIIEFGRKQMSGQKYDLEKSTVKQKILFVTFGAVHNYTESIYLLCKSVRPQPAIVLLRGIFEAWVNTFYLLSTRSKKRLALFYMEFIQNKIKLLNGLLDFIKKYPSQRDRNPLTVEDNLKKAKSDNEKIKLVMTKHFKLKENDKWPDLLSRARACDKISDRKRPRNLRKGNFEHIYHIIYRFSSPYTHLNARGLDNFLKPKLEGGYYLAASQSADWVEQVLASAFAFYLSFLEYMKKKGLLPKSLKLERFRKMARKNVWKKNKKENSRKVV